MKHFSKSVLLASAAALAIPAMPRSILSVRAEPDPAAMLVALNTAFDAFKAANDERLKGIDKKFDDVVTNEKVDKINGSITDLTKAIDDLNKKAAAGAMGGGNNPKDSPERRAYSTAFNHWFRTGEGEASLNDLAVKATLTTQSKPDGGYLVSPEVETTIDRVMGLISVMRQIATVRQIGTDEYTKFVNMAGTGTGWVGETDARPNTGTPTLRKLDFPVMELYANPMATQKMLDDGTIIDVAGWLADEVNIAFAEQEGTAFITGDGNKKPRGLLAYPTIANASYAWGSVGFIATGNSAGFASSNPTDNLIDLYYALKPGYRNGASWLTSDVVMNSIRKFKDGQGNYIWAPPTGVDMPSTILGKAVYSDDNMQALGANAYPVAFGDFKRAYLILDRMGVRILRDPFTNKPYVQFYTTKRVGGGLQSFEAVKLLKCA
jgi:HK97 family phage major capsid protein